MPELRKNPRQRRLLHLAVQIALLAGLALVSGYKIPDFSDSSWLTVLFLTPSGIISNHLDSESVIRSFYGDLSAGQVSLSQSQIIFILLIYLGLVTNLIIFLRNEKVSGR